MEAVIGLLLLTLGFSHGWETSCDGRQNGTQCYGALGGTVAIQLMDSASEIHIYKWLKNKTVILNGRRTAILYNAIANRSLFTVSNGTFRINSLSSSDGGEYELQTFNSKGRQLEPQTLQLIIQAPVSSVLLHSECLSQGELRVSCSSEGGDSPQYSWTLNGRTLTDAELLPGNNETNSITLKQHVSGQLVCSVRNHVSRVSEEEKISNCGFIFINCTSDNDTQISQWVFAANNTLCIETTTTTMRPDTTVGHLPVMAGVLSALVILLMVGVAVVCTHKRKQNSKPQEDDEEEITYADVRIKQRPGRHVPQREEMEVEYGQIRISERPRRSVKPAEDECVYAKVRKAR